ncbi:hypothetical protein [Photobacterium rosenbergii]|uniref:Uncharacterized protein n=1 Tax=Photobacterium rosenbergii TaxID=294936 RepID=A0ABU3ZJ39_9GAMM|nr:hypothetical protein [Photobacterium rosenbergii]MDV5169903.1 hypothetical protein [Photobacterium rosenbergii]
MKIKQKKVVVCTSIAMALMGMASAAVNAEPYEMLLSDVLADE